jgi:hypothetical protein
MAIKLSPEQLESIANYIQENNPMYYDTLLEYDNFTYNHRTMSLFPGLLFSQCLSLINLNYSRTSYSEDLNISKQIIRHIKANPWQTFGKPSI